MHPFWIGSDRGIAGNGDHGRAATCARGGGQRAKQSLRQTERSEQVHPDGLLQLFAFGIGQQRERDRSQGRSIVDERVEPAEIAGDLNGDRVTPSRPLMIINGMSFSGK
jgi:hypothetical protein